jgi:hypothetical protein
MLLELNNNNNNNNYKFKHEPTLQSSRKFVVR